MQKTHNNMRIAHSTLLVTLSLATLPFATGCIALAVGGVGAVLVHDSMDNSTYTAQVRANVTRSWTSVKSTLSHLSTKPITTNDELRSATADIDGGVATVTVEAFDLDQSTIRVSAKKFGINNGTLAKVVHDKILDDLAR